MNSNLSLHPTIIEISGAEKIAYSHLFITLFEKTMNKSRSETKAAGYNPFRCTMVSDSAEDTERVIVPPCILGEEEIYESILREIEAHCSSLPPKDDILIRIVRFEVSSVHQVRMLRAA